MATRSPSSRPTSSSRRTWSQNATNIVAQKYFRGQLSSPARERSVKQMIGRVAGTIADWGRSRGYFATAEDGDSFEAELTYVLLHQMAAFNSPVWFNCGWHPEDSPKNQMSACFILSVDDSMESILDWNTKEGLIFRGGSGSGINLSKIRGSMEPLSKGGTASGPVSFMRGADAWAGSIKSGGGTRRAAKMVVLDVDHPDIREFIWCKAKEEDKAAALRDAGFDMSIDGEGFYSIQYQNANNSVRLNDDFMRAVENDEDWNLIARTTGEPIGDPIPARELMREISEAAWRCADPGVQYDTTINQWHTSPNSGRINASNPCSEYMHVDNSACNLASINLMKFRRPDGTLDVDAFEHTVDVVFLAQEIIVGPSSYPTEEIAVNARAFRQLGLGYANLGAYLMSNGMPYDSDAGRGTAAAITALMTGPRVRAVGQGGRGHRALRALRGEPRRAQQRHAHAPRRVVRDPRLDAARDTALLDAARTSWEEAVELGEVHGYRNAQATVLAPTGTISFLHGLRHHRRRARLLARQVQGARRRRPDDDRQPHDPDGAADARLLRRADRADRGPHQRARDDHRRARAGRRAPAGVRRRRRRARDLAHGPHQDDGRGAALPLGRDLQDGEPAPDGDASRTSPTPTSRRGAAASRRWPSTATARRPRRRCAPTPSRASDGRASPRPWPRPSRACTPRSSSTPRSPRR